LVSSFSTSQGRNTLERGRSAKELAKSWCRSGSVQIPSEILELLESNSNTKGFNIEYGIPEMETKLDGYKGNGRNHDLILIGESVGMRTLVAIEAKVDESFGDIASEYIFKRLQDNSITKVPQRIKELSSAIFGDKDTGAMRYQLIHAIAGTLIEAKNLGATKAVFLVHEFIPKIGKSKKALQNEIDLMQFFQLLTNRQNISLGKLIGPLNIPGGGLVPSNIPLFIGKIESGIV
jgi:hypothetical protein